MELYFFGTGAGMPTKQRNVTSIALGLQQERGTFWMFDCGEGTQQQILKSPYKLSKLEKLFITHLHGDHLYGVPGLLTSRSYSGGESDFTVYGPVGIRNFIETALRVSGAHLGYKLEVVEVEEGTVFADETFRVSAGKLVHRIECFGYRIEENDLPGKLDTQKLLSRGIAPGPLYKRIQRGESVELEDGTYLNGYEFVGQARKGRVVALLGDTRYVPAAVRLAEGADAMVHEATFASKHQELADKYDHSTSVDAARVALEAGVKSLIMTHLSSRYQEEEVSILLEEARRLFPNAHVASDFSCFPLARK